jgi:L,D-peptidoglycan transpeptidase YkuD (ErfK/YbiS/YcfS/YnhG family)
MLSTNMVTQLHIRAKTMRAVQCRLHLGHLVFPCLVGRTGRIFRKREGDGKTPVGTWALTKGFYRADRMRKPPAENMRHMRASDGWCEKPGSQFYNAHVKLPFRHAHETMVREDEAYDIVFATDHNMRPRVQGAGSAIFFHLTRKGANATAGCVAVSKSDMLKILSFCHGKASLKVWPC